MKRGYETRGASVNIQRRAELEEKRKVPGLTCREGGELDFLRNIDRNPSHYAPKKAK